MAAYLNATRRLVEIKERQEKLEWEAKALAAERTKMEAAVSIPIGATNEALVEAALPLVGISGEVDYELPSNERWRYEGYNPRTRRNLLNAAIEDVAGYGYTERLCKTYDRWYDQRASLNGYGTLSHGTLTFGIFAGRRNVLDDAQREAVLHVLCLLRDGILTTEQFTALQKAAEEVA